jgi:hypothetical protein
MRSGPGVVALGLEACGPLPSRAPRGLGAGSRIRRGSLRTDPARGA